MRRNVYWIVASLGVVVCLSALSASAQSTTTTATKQFEVIAVDGNQLVVKLPEGTREISVPPGFMFTVNGKQLSVQDLKPGMAGTATITTTTTMKPVTVTEVKNGTVEKVTGSTVLVRTEAGYRMFNQGEVDKRNIKIMKDGRLVQIEELNTGDRLSATIVTSKPPQTLTEQQVQATLAAPAAAPAPSRAAAPAPASPPPASSSTGMMASADTSSAQLPHTASPLPAVGFGGLIALAVALGLTVRRRRLS